ncbi:hypothetical protein PB2503_10724 [Parvularcula bermudensis HTCC2503]|uniref:Phytase-like domain-containing protein n=1 Tax=Parvularcula bermudensis (strain ATCC BAA-594 / HTCC2503 / KCTC 12087) TaxID=314260 RepID=E0THA6_PARBH|nr:esterase-like activity of phytase family protein [Parvularcula bermudensis]ADM10196.1 hypothetical protein PB2503_10724 [Parvularcula bermudensis HTCC2503]
MSGRYGLCGLGALLVVMTSAAAQQVTPLSQPFPGFNNRPIHINCATQMVSGITLTAADARFGGFSALNLSKDEIVLLSDRGLLWTGTVGRDQNGYITEVISLTPHPLADAQGRFLGKRRGDAESLVIEGQRLLIGIEGDHRLSWFTEDGDLYLEEEPPFYAVGRNALPNNAGFEGVTAWADGYLAITEHTRPSDGTAALTYLSRGGEVLGRWRYRPAGDFSPTGLTTTADGSVYVLERAFSALSGPRARLVQLSPEALRLEETPPSPPILDGLELARLTILHGVDNMEGLVVEPLEDGTLRVHLVSDHNFNPLQRTVIVGLHIDPGCLTAPDTEDNADAALH